jgi:hypothetical protein
MTDLSVMWSEKYAGRIAIYDYYLPVIGLVAIALGKETADLTEDDLPRSASVSPRCAPSPPRWARWSPPRPRSPPARSTS